MIRETGREVFDMASGQRKDDKETWWWNEEDIRVFRGRGLEEGIE